MAQKLVEERKEPSLQMFWVGYRLCGVVIWSTGSYFQPDSGDATHVVRSGVGGWLWGVTLVHLGVSACAPWQWHEEKGAFYTHSLHKRTNVTIDVIASLRAFLLAQMSDILSQHFRPTYLIVKRLFTQKFSWFDLLTNVLFLKTCVVCNVL